MANANSKAAFMKNLKSGMKVQSLNGWQKGNVRKCGVIQTNAFTLETLKEGKVIQSWVWLSQITKVVEGVAYDMDNIAWLKIIE
jgi:hypothetical protein